MLSGVLLKNKTKNSGVPKKKQQRDVFLRRMTLDTCKAPESVLM
jgi:hypothetical protein